MTGRDLAKGVVTVGGTLTKWGIQGAGLVLTCGVKGAFLTGGLAADLAKQFSGDSLGTPIANTVEKASMKGGKAVTKTAANGMSNLTDYVRDRI